MPSALLRWPETSETSWNTREWASWQLETAEFAENSGRRRDHWASEVPSSQRWNTVHGNPVPAISARGISVGCKWHQEPQNRADNGMEREGSFSGSWYFYCILPLLILWQGEERVAFVYLFSAGIMIKSIIMSGKNHITKTITSVNTSWAFSCTRYERWGLWNQMPEPRSYSCFLENVVSLTTGECWKVCWTQI